VRWVNRPRRYTTHYVATTRGPVRSALGAQITQDCTFWYNMEVAILTVRTRKGDEARREQHRGEGGLSGLAVVGFASLLDQDGDLKPQTP
jgi:hypothetical protein